MRRLPRHDIHPANPQSRLLAQVATQLRAGAVAAVPSAAGYALVCQLDDKAATGRLRRSTGLDDRAPAALLCRDVAQAATYLHIDDRAFRVVRAADDGSRAFALRATRRVPRRLAGAAGGMSQLHFAGHAVLQGLLNLLDEALLIGLPAGGTVATLEQMPGRWLGTTEVALDAGPLPAARPVQMIDLEGLCEVRPSLSRWMGAAPALA